jgi:hypothetical protein
VELTEDKSIVEHLVKVSVFHNGVKVDSRILKDIFLQVSPKPENSLPFVASRETNPLARGICGSRRSNGLLFAGRFLEGERHHGAGALALAEANRPCRAV